MIRHILLTISLLCTLPITAQVSSNDSITNNLTKVYPHRAKDSSLDRNILRAALKGWEIELKAGYAIGGTSPLPLPRSIRHINSYNPQLNLYLGGNALKKICGPWGISVGLNLETKGMTTKAEVADYHTEITEDDGGHTEGNWYGPVKTRVHNIYVTIPLLATYTFSSERWSLHAGPYISYLIDGDFSGTVNDGFIRTPNETGENVDVTHATYDFSKELRDFQWGLALGTTYCAYKHLYIDATLNWGLNGIFPSDFKTVDFALYPIYANIGFSYRF